MSLFFIQPYYSWRGHFKKYTDSLTIDANEAIVVSSRQFKNIIDYTFLRFICSAKAIFQLRKKLTSDDNCYFLEFEPLSYLIFYPIIIKAKTVFFTVHAVSAPDLGNLLKVCLVNFQRLLFKFAIRIYSKKSNVNFIVHSQNHKAELTAVNGISTEAKIHVIDYPCPVPEQIVTDNDIAYGYTSNNILCFGAMRTDKQLAPFIQEISNFGYKGFDFIFSGVITDPDIKKIKNNLPDFIAINDGFIDDTSLAELISQSRYMLVPYGSSYTGGAGPLKDAASFGKPCIVSDLPLFREVNETAKYCLSFSNVKDLYNKLDSINIDKYTEMARNATRYSKTNNWSTLRDRYTSLS